MLNFSENDRISLEDFLIHKFIIELKKEFSNSEDPKLKKLNIEKTKFDENITD